MIGMGSKTLLSQNSGNLPDVSDALRSWLQKITFQIIGKVVEDYQTYETHTNLSFDGVWQPMGPAQLRMKAEGQRTWPWFVCHTLNALELKTDEVIIFQDSEYRVMEVTRWTQYGYYEYHLVKDWSGLEKTEEVV
jgi:hypothetical protein